MIRFVFLFLIALASCAPAKTDRPNIVIIYADDLGYGDLSVNGATKIRTPNIDRLANEGIRFTSAYATSAMCTPSRYSLLTGEYAFRLPGAGILSAEDPMLIRPGTYTLPEMLRQVGYRTAIVGKWHLGLGDTTSALDWNAALKPGPLEVGFDESFLLPVTNDRVPTVYLDGHFVHNLKPTEEPLQVVYPAEGHHAYQEERFGNYDSPQNANRPLVGNLPTGLTHPRLQRYPADVQHAGTIVNGVARIGHMSGAPSAWWDDETMADVFTERSKAFIRDQKDGPFFLFLSMPENHVPRIPHPRFVGTSETGLRGDVVHQLDWVVGEIVRTLDELGLRENTIILISSDNGPVLFDGYEDGALESNGDHLPGGPFRGGKYLAYEAGTRMPTIANWPSRIAAGHVSDAIWSQVDLLASLAALTGADVPEGAAPDSQNMLPVILGDQKTGRDAVVLQSSDGLALRQGPWKYIPVAVRSDWGYNRHNQGNTTMNLPRMGDGAYLFNLDSDPNETTNLAEEHPQRVTELDQRLKDLTKALVVNP